MNNADQYRRLILENAVRKGIDPKAAIREFVDVLTEIREARRIGDETQQQLLELGPQFAHYKGEPGAEACSGTLLPEKDLRRTYAILKTRLRASNRSVSILTNAANGLLGGPYLQRGRPVAGPDGTALPSPDPLMSTEVGEIVVLDGDTDEPIILEMI
jgi:hypothetical protein